MQTSAARAASEAGPSSATMSVHELESEDCFRLVADSAPVMIWLVGPDKQFEWFNKTWLDYTGRPIESEHGAGWMAGVHSEDLERCAGIYHTSFDARERFTMDFRLRRHDGSYRWLMATGVPRVSADGDFHGYTGSCVDIHERKELEERLAERARALRLADRQKNEFLAMLAHDLRNPLGPITNVVALMQRMESDTPAVAPLRRIIERQLDQLKRVIADMRDVTRVTQTRPELHCENVTVAEIVQRSVEATQGLFDSRGHRLHIEGADQAITVWGDAARLSQALEHLLANAAKFTTTPGVVDLRVELRGPSVELRVVDRGQGIAPDFLPHVFEAFAQENRATPRTSGGLGVGLTIAKRLAELHGGDVHAASEGTGHGAQFVLSLPVRDA
ncbi:PAS domain-containing sensor histidine kinase [Piscinibacter sp. XHJ-5]|uniref:PAS domain-containing sensor histidine kinase n=1 Tax=Piscinibacter sp. XHJ-5 TaxID=3037797 RepID=UPI002452B151|nr:PAS domain-containing sensor histidine kinase [Piscinibacter sp. XHJ-5]